MSEVINQYLAPPAMKIWRCPTCRSVIHPERPSLLAVEPDGRPVYQIPEARRQELLICKNCDVEWYVRFNSDGVALYEARNRFEPGYQGREEFKDENGTWNPEYFAD